MDEGSENREVTDRDILLDILASQQRVEKAVSEFLATIAPTVKAVSKGGVMGLLTSMRG